MWLAQAVTWKRPLAVSRSQPVQATSVPYQDILRLGQGVDNVQYFIDFEWFTNKHIHPHFPYLLPYLAIATDDYDRYRRTHSSSTKFLYEGVTVHAPHHKIQKDEIRFDYSPEFLQSN